jgi:hypothetical protein
MMPRNEVESRRRYPKANVNTMAMGIRGGRTSLPKKLLAASNMIARSQAADTTVVPTSHGHRRGFGPAQVRMPKQSPKQCNVEEIVLSDYLEDDENHWIAPFESETDKFLVRCYIDF